jgi:predicted phosphoribosyltransferase
MFRDRREAGRVLGRLLDEYRGRPDVQVLALPRGGVPVAAEVARALGAPLDVLVVRKLGVPGHEELAMGAIALGGLRVLNADVVEALGVTDADIERVAREESAELARRERLYRGERPWPAVAGKVAIVVDDGLATGATMRAAVGAMRAAGAARVVVAVPVGAAESCALVAKDADEVVCAATPEPFHAVGLWYDDFSETSDEEVRALLEGREPPHGAGGVVEHRDEARP